MILFSMVRISFPITFSSFDSMAILVLMSDISSYFFVISLDSSINSVLLFRFFIQMSVIFFSSSYLVKPLPNS